MNSVEENLDFLNDKGGCFWILNRVQDDEGVVRVVSGL